MPLLVIFQIPAASHINRIGYRKFVLADNLRGDVIRPDEIRPDALFAEIKAGKSDSEILAYVTANSSPKRHPAEIAVWYFSPRPELPR